MPEILFTFKDDVPESLEDYKEVVKIIYDVVVRAMQWIGQKEPTLDSVIASAQDRAGKTTFFNDYDDLEVTLFMSDEASVIHEIKYEILEALKEVLKVAIHNVKDFSGTFSLILTLNNGGYRFVANVQLKDKK